MKIENIFELFFFQNRQRSVKLQFQIFFSRNFFSNLIFFYMSTKYFFGKITDENGGLVFSILIKNYPQIFNSFKLKIIKF